MRIAPLAVFLSKIEDDEKFYDILREEVTITHTHLDVLHAAFVYTQAISFLLNNPTNGDRAN